MIKGRLAAAAICAGLITGGASAACWSDEELAAARVRDMRSMLMVATLSCRATGIDISADYNALVRARRAMIEDANATLKGGFWAAGPVNGQRDYDRVTTRLANGYGSGDTGPESCAEAAALSRAAAAPTDDAGALLQFAANRILAPSLVADRCVSACGASPTLIATR